MKSETYNADCLDLMRRWPDSKFDLAVVDPPYFSGPERRRFYGSKYSSKGIKRVDYPVSKNWTVPGKEYFDELIRISKHQIVWGCNYYQYQFGPGRIIWDKVNGESTFSDCEEAFCSFHDSIRLFRFMWNGAMQGKSALNGHIMQGNKTKNEKRIHPTQKPVELYRWIFNKYTAPGMSVLDTHLGSGSSRIAAHDAGLQFTGIEIDPVHFKNQEKRFIQHTDQLLLKLKY